MEYWDLYDRDRNKLSKVVKRGDKLLDNEYHLVINAWIRNKKGEFLITQRASNKSHPLMWECTGGSALKGESSLDAAVREVKEELGIDVSKSKAKLIGSTTRYYKNCPDILDVFLFESDVSIEDVFYQEEEVSDAMWASVNKINELFNEGKFEANAFFSRVLSLNEKVYYIGFNANNAICNENFFSGSISLYPNKEKENIYYSHKFVEDTKSSLFMDKYKKYIYDNCRKIQDKDKNVKFICFNEKIRNLCKDMNDINVLSFNDKSLLETLNNKFKVRDLLKDEVSLIDYFFVSGKELDYDLIKKKVGACKFVLQGEVGAGGDNTYLIENKSDLLRISDKSLNYCISKYIKHIPLNITLIIGEYETIYLPISAQLIALTDKKYKYVGADFIYPDNLSLEIKEKIISDSKKIASIMKKMGYRGILGIDFILSSDNKLYFMEINPRFQASSFLISLSLQKYCSMDIAELHYLAATKRKIGGIHLDKIEKSFLNCNEEQEFADFSDYQVIDNGYFKENNTSYYRKVFNRSILLNKIFENID